MEYLISNRENVYQLNESLSNNIDSDSLIKKCTVSEEKVNEAYRIFLGCPPQYSSIPDNLKETENEYSYEVNGFTSEDISIQFYGLLYDDSNNLHHYCMNYWDSYSGELYKTRNSKVKKSYKSVSTLIAERIDIKGDIS
ncbi:MAG: hypothetical protein MJ119_01560 [Lachnospiraceae bacterium]|nr:hypothetical protein [Lachnospiraceae bacterium]